MAAWDDDFGPWYSTSEAAPLLGLSQETVQKLCVTGQLEANFKVGPKGRRRYRISREQIARYNRRTSVKAS